MEAPSLRVWRDLGVVDTIYEEEDSFTRTSSSPPSLLSPVISSPSSPLQSRVNAWYVLFLIFRFFIHYEREEKVQDSKQIHLFLYINDGKKYEI